MKKLTALLILISIGYTYTLCGDVIEGQRSRTIVELTETKLKVKTIVEGDEAIIKYKAE